LCAQRSASLAAEGDLIGIRSHWNYASQSVVTLASVCLAAEPGSSPGIG
jgi:hypothetical protein